MRKSLLILCFLVVTKWGGIMAQEHIVHGTTPDLYLVHKVAAKETWYSLGRTYNLSPKEIAAYNKLTMEKGLDIGQEIRVPLTAANFTQSDSRGPGETFVPVYHLVGEREWMYRISVNHNKVPIEQLEKWNNISRDQAKAGTPLIVGFLKVRDGNAALATASTSTSTTAAAPERPATPAITEKPASTSAVEAPVAQTKTTAADQPAVAQEKAASGQANKNGGYFRSLYNEKGTTSSGVAGIFKSTSGWNDGKYYVLMSNVIVGTIVKITFPSTNKSVYAKVLGELPEMKESAGLLLRMSDAAASELGAANSKFSVTVKY